MNTSRRAFLASAAAAGPLLAGCLGGDSGADDSGGTQRTTASTESTSVPASSTTESTMTGSTTAESTTGPGSTVDTTNAPSTAATSLDHPAATTLASQPFLGPTPGTAPSIIAFEDPSCNVCERFNTGTFPELEAELIEPDEVSYVYRNFPYAFEWGRSAMAALEATYARNEAAFWSLKDHYFTTQNHFDDGNVLERTEAFLTSETDLDAEAVITAVRTGEFEAAVERDVSAGEAAGVVSTPTFFLFRDGTFLTEIRGAQSYQVFAQALGVR